MKEDRNRIKRDINAYTIGWICALAIEQTASCALFDTIHSFNGHPDVPSSRDGLYILASIKSHNIVLATLEHGVTGNSAAGAVAGRLTVAFPAIKFIFMVGIGGGIPNLKEGIDIRLGDVVVSAPDGGYSGVVEWDLGKIGARNVLTRTGSLNRPPGILLSAINNLQTQHRLFGGRILGYISMVYQNFPRLQEFRYPGKNKDNLYHEKYEHSDLHPRNCEACDPGMRVSRAPRASEAPEVHPGIIASGNRVVKTGDFRDWLRSEFKAKCVDMEGAGTIGAFPCLVVRGICDYADSHKNDEWQPYAALVAAAYTKELIELLSTEEIVDMPTAQEVNTESSSKTLTPTPTPGSGMSTVPSHFEWINVATDSGIQGYPSPTPVPGANRLSRAPENPPVPFLIFQNTNPAQLETADTQIGRDRSVRSKQSSPNGQPSTDRERESISPSKEELQLEVNSILHLIGLAFDFKDEGIISLYLPYAIWTREKEAYIRLYHAHTDQRLAHIFSIHFIGKCVDVDTFIDGMLGIPKQVRFQLGLREIFQVSAFKLRLDIVCRRNGQYDILVPKMRQPIWSHKAPSGADSTYLRYESAPDNPAFGNKIQFEYRPLD